ncbi:MAG: tRNA-dihydrouridine synthase family protein [Eubacteriales bacterium]|nr:tRNA-dihydrouridine synthase family protein [Eubacteriales bacterium]
MKIYLAPLENITTHVYRNTMHEMFGESIDTYFMPFFMPHTKISLDEKEKRQLASENNLVETLIPQILTDDAEGFWRMATGIVDRGYQEININIGCPSHKVASKGRGAGLLERKEKLDAFLDGVFEKKPKEIDISVKTRIGTRKSEEFYDLLEIYNKYPLKELIIHPRTGLEKYSGFPHREYFYYALTHSKNPLSYNGDIYTVEDYHNFLQSIREYLAKETPDLNAEEMIESMTGIMMGRGLLANPALGREIKGGPKVTGEELLQFMRRYRENCQKAPRMDKKYYLLNKSKEIWSFMRVHYKDREEEVRQIFLTNDYEHYLTLEEKFFLGGEFYE